MTTSISAGEPVADGFSRQQGRTLAGPETLSYRTIAFSDFDTVSHLLDGLEGSTFQSPFWLSAWFRALGDVEGLDRFLVLVEDQAGLPLLALPLVRRVLNNVRVIEAPDLGVSDYAAPLVRRSALGSLPHPELLWERIKAMLPPADLLHFCRQPPVIRGMVNPLYGHSAARRNRLNGWVLPLGACWDEYFASLSPKMREKLKKMGRKFDREPCGARKLVTTVDEAMAILDDLERLQGERIERKGLAYHLDEPAVRAFYRTLIKTGLPAGKVQMTALLVEGKTVAANLGVISGNELVYLRVANEFGDWARHALGLVVTELAISEAQRRGIRTFDFTMGNYDYKRRFGAIEMPLQDLVLPLNWRGWPVAIGWHLRAWASTVPLLRRLFGKSETNKNEPGKSGCSRSAEAQADNRD